MIENSKIKYNIYTNDIIYNNILNLSENDEFEKDFTYHYLYIIHYIRTYPFLDRRYNPDSFIPVNMKILKKYISYDYAHIFLNNLVDWGILTRDNFYMPKFKSVSYKINDIYRIEKFYLKEVEDINLSNKITKLLRREKQKVIDRQDAYSFITLCMENLKINKEEAYKNAKNDFHNMCIDIFETKFSTVDKTGNRLHNNLTNLPTELRKYLSYNSNSIFQADIRNSQPVFLYTVMKNYHIPETEMEKYKDVVLNIGFYEFFAGKLNMELNEENRNVFKKKIFSGVLFDVNRKELTKYEKVFKDEFPSIFSVIRVIKSKNHKDVPIMLQKEESKFIFYVISELIKKYKNKIPLLTIHDSIATTEEYIEDVKNSILEFFQKLYSIEPKLKIEKFA